MKFFSVEGGTIIFGGTGYGRTVDVILGIIFLIFSVFFGWISLKAFLSRKRCNLENFMFYAAMSIINFLGFICDIIPESNYGSSISVARIIVRVIAIICTIIMALAFISSYISKKKRQKMEKVAVKYPSRMGLRNPESVAAAKATKTVAEAASIKPKRV